MQRSTIFYQNFIAFNFSFLPFFKKIASLQRVLRDDTNNKGTISGALFCFVGMARFELATSWSQTRRDNRATLHPERKAVSKIFFVAERVGVEPTVQFNPYDDLANRSFRPLRHLSFCNLHLV